MAANIGKNGKIFKQLYLLLHKLGNRLDKKDISILWELSQDATLPLVKIAKKVGLPKETVKYRFEQLQKRGVLKKFFAIVNSSALGLRFYETFIKLHGIPPEKLQSSIEKLKAYKYTGWLLSTSGPFTLCCTFLVRTPEQLYEACFYIRSMFGKYLKKIHTNHAVESKQFSYPFFKDFDKFSLKTSKHYTTPISLDPVDTKLLEILTENCRTPKRVIAKRVGITEKTVRMRIKSLEKRGLIKRYTTLLHPGRAGYYFYILFIHASLPNDELEEFLVNLPEIFYIKKKSVGFYDYKVELYVDAESRIHAIEEELYRRFSGIVQDVDIVHVKKEYMIRYFVDA